MSKQTTLSLGPSGLKHSRQSTVKASIDKCRDLMAKLGDSLDKVKRGPVKTATEAGFNDETVEETKKWCSELDTVETTLQTSANQLQRVNDAVDQVHEDVRNADAALEGADDPLDDNAEKALAADMLGWLLQSYPRMRLFVESLGCEMTPRIEEALAQMDLDGPNNSLVDRMSQVATQGPSREELAERVASLEEELKTSQDKAQAQGLLIDTLTRDQGALKVRLSNQKAGEESFRKKMERQLEKADELRMNAEVAERAQNREMKQANLRTETAEQLVLDKDKELHEHEIQVKSLEGRQETLQELVNEEKQRVTTLEQEVQRLKDDSQKQLEANESLREDRNVWKGLAAQRETCIKDLEAQVGGGKEQLAQQQGLLGDQRALINERDQVKEELRKARLRADNNKDSAQQWKQLCEDRKATITRLQRELDTKLREKDEQLVDITEKRDVVSFKLDVVRQAVRDQKALVETWTQRCGRRDETIGERDDEIERLDLECGQFKVDLRIKERQVEKQQEELDSMKAEQEDLEGECSSAQRTINSLSKKVASQKSKLARQKTNLEELDKRTQNQVSNLQGKEDSARTMARLVMTNCPSGEWQDIMGQIDWNSPVVAAEPTPQSWEILETWSRNDVLKVEKRTESLTALFLLVIAAIETESLDDLVEYLGSIQLRLDDDSECILPVVSLFLDSLSKCLKLQAHTFQVFLFLRVAQRVGKAWPQVQDTVSDIVQNGDEHAMVSSLCRAVEAWEQRDQKVDLQSDLSIQYDDLTLVGFYREPNGILVFGKRELRWVDWDFVEIDGPTITLGIGEDSIDLDPEGDGWHWWMEHIL